MVLVHSIKTLAKYFLCQWQAVAVVKVDNFAGRFLELIFEVELPFVTEIFRQFLFELRP